MICQSCGGKIGRDCFNPQECAEIEFAQEQEYRRRQEFQQNRLNERIQELETQLAQVLRNKATGGEE